MESSFLFDSVPFVCYLDTKGSAVWATAQATAGTAEKILFYF